MSHAPHSIEVTKTVEIVDADGLPIRVGSVLKNIPSEADRNGPDRGVVVDIILPGQPRRGMMAAGVGDLIIKLQPAVYRVTNRYTDWRHIPRKDQTYSERFLAWQSVDYEHDDTRRVSRDEGCAMEGILALLPESCFTESVDPWPESLEDALEHLVAHMERLAAENKALAR